MTSIPIYNFRLPSSAVFCIEQRQSSPQDAKYRNVLDQRTVQQTDIQNVPVLVFKFWYAWKFTLLIQVVQK
eukprot:4308348-Amphidinium_carterae.1